MIQIKPLVHKVLYIILALSSLFFSPALSLFAGIVLALLLGCVFEKYLSRISSKLLKIAVVGLGLGMNLFDSLKSSSDGIIFTIFSVVIVMLVGVLLSKYLKVGKKAGYLISAGTAICGGSAIAAISPVVKAKSGDISISLAVIFTLNALAMLSFPYIGSFLELTQSEFGMWAAIAIHDTSAVVGAAKMYGEEALEIATTVKLSRALWIIPLSLVTVPLFRKENKGAKGKISIPWFILLFILAMVLNTYFPLGEKLSDIVKLASHKILSLTLFIIGSTLSLENIKEAGFKPILLGVVLWVLISVLSLVVITL